MDYGGKFDRFVFEIGIMLHIKYSFLVKLEFCKLFVMFIPKSGGRLF